MESTDHKSQASQIATKDLVYELQSSAAPRFLLSLFQLPDGHHGIIIDNDELSADDRQGQLEVWHVDGVRNAMLVYSNTHQGAQGLEPVYSFYTVNGPELGVSHGTSQSEPDTPQYTISLADLANETSIEDFCDLHSLRMVAAKCGLEAPLPTTDI